MKMNYYFFGMSLVLCASGIQTAPLGLFEPYDIMIRLRKPAQNNFYVGLLGEKSYTTKGYATDACEEETLEVNSLQVYDRVQNVVSLYQGMNQSDSEFIPLLESIAGGPGGGASNYENGLFQATGKLGVEQLAFSTIYGLPRHFYVSGYVPFYVANLSNLSWNYVGNSILFSGQEIQELVDAFKRDSEKLFGLCVKNWKRHGFGDVTLLFEWQRDFAQMRPILKSVQPNVRCGISIPTECLSNQNLIMPITFSSRQTASIPFGGGLTMNLANHIDVGFAAQFWYYLSNKCQQRIKTFPTQTSLLYPVSTLVMAEYGFLQNFNLFAQIYSFCKRLSLKFCYQYWRRGEDRITPIDLSYNYEIANSAPQLLENTMHDVFFALNYAPKVNDFKRVIPQAQLFWKASVKGMRVALASTVGFQFSVIF
ncbi:hypothetical protein HYV11_03755 [Candidatus Dependentiae bacterium]|nr:hypothetical protein [Candidatus Dependentiae bacterium]